MSEVKGQTRYVEGGQINKKEKALAPSILKMCEKETGGGAGPRGKTRKGFSGKTIEVKEKIG